jgi:hypothetical protein
MREQLEILNQEIERLRTRIGTNASSSKQQYSIRAAAMASDAARLLLNEVLDWRVVFLDRPFEQPPA